MSSKTRNSRGRWQGCRPHSTGPTWMKHLVQELLLIVHLMFGVENLRRICIVGIKGNVECVGGIRIVHGALTGASVEGRAHPVSEVVPLCACTTVCASLHASKRITWPLSRAKVRLYPVGERKLSKLEGQSWSFASGSLMVIAERTMSSEYAYLVTSGIGQLIAESILDQQLKTLHKTTA